MLFDAFDNKEVDRFIYQLFDNYGFINPKTNEYINYLKLLKSDDLTKVHKMMQQLIIAISYITLKKQGFKNQQDYIIKLML